METKRCRSDEEDDLDTFSSSSSSSKFGCFILHTTLSPVINTRSRKHLSEHALLMLTSDSESDDPEKCISRSRSRSVTDCLSSITTGSNDDDNDTQLVLRLRNLGFPCPYKFNMHDKEVVGSCNGLVCLQDRRTSRFKPHEGSISLWNPATGQFRILPQSVIFGQDRPLPTMAVFGFDFETKDYKVVLFTGLFRWWNGYGPKECFCKVQVYSLSTDSWRILEDIPCLPGYPYLYQHALYLNGTCFFLARFFWTKQRPCLPQNDRFIISFDLTKEIVTPIQLPDHDRNQELVLCNYMGDKIALFASPKFLPYTDDFTIWVLNYDEHGSRSVNKKSWEKRHSFPLPLDRSYQPRGISNDGKYALLESPAEIGCSRKMNLYNLTTNEVKSKFLPCRQVWSKAYAYEPSQVSVMSNRNSNSNSNNL